MEDSGAESAIEDINKGLERIRQLYIDIEAEDQFEENELVIRLNPLRESPRDYYHVGRTLNEQLAEAVAKEEYELAARLRDEINRRSRN